MSKADDIAAALMGAIGANSEQSTVTQWLNTGYIPLNQALSGRRDGGLPVGRITEIFGPPSSGKTAIATEAMTAAQKLGGVAGFMDHERSFDQRLAVGNGLDAGGRFVYRTPRTFEESLTVAIKAWEALRAKKSLLGGAPITWVFDSLAAMVPQSKLEKGFDGYNMHDNFALAKATSAAFPAFTQFVEELDVCCIFLNQLKIKPGIVYGDPTTTPGGDAPKFYASIRVQLGSRRLVKGKGDDAVQIGSEVGCKVVKNKITAPFKKAAWRFMFRPDGTGFFDNVGSLVEYLADAKILVPAGPRVTWTDGKTYHRGELAARIQREGLVKELEALIPETGLDAVEIPLEEAA